MSAIPTLRERLDDADAVLRSVRRLERMQRTNRRAGPTEARAVAAIRAGVYVMIYNAVESSVRTTFANLRSAIQAEGVHFAGAKAFWQLDFVQSTFLERMQQGTNHGNVLADFVPAANTHLSWAVDRIGDMPTTGNFGQGSAFEIRRRLELAWQPPAVCVGGADLEIVRTSRNDLAHGFEAYDIVGARTTTADLFRVVDRTRIFMVSMVEAIERYQAGRSYLR